MTTKFYKVPVLRSEWELPERYKNLKLVKRTAFGQVCSATDTIFDVTVEIKKFNKPFVSIENAKRAFREIKTLKFVNHENIVGLLDVFCRDDSLYFITEHSVDNLNNIIRTQRLSNENIQLLIYQIINGLNYLHNIGISHGDLKPSDIGLNKNFELKIIDLNVERPCEKEYVITKWYKAPELLYAWKPESEKKTADMWSVGCIFAEFLSGRILFAGRDHLQQLKLIIELLGSPKSEFFEPSTTMKSLYNQNLMEGEKFIKSLPFMRRRNFSRYFEDADSLAVDLIEQLLVLEPEQRITSEEALNHAFFKDFPKKKYENLVKFDNSFEAEEYPLDKWRDLIHQDLAVD